MNANKFVLAMRAVFITIGLSIFVKALYVAYTGYSHSLNDNAHISLLAGSLALILCLCTAYAIQPYSKKKR